MTQKNRREKTFLFYFGKYFFLFVLYTFVAHVGLCRLSCAPGCAFSLFSVKRRLLCDGSSTCSHFRFLSVGAPERLYNWKPFWEDKLLEIGIRRYFEGSTGGYYNPKNRRDVFCFFANRLFRVPGPRVVVVFLLVGLRFRFCSRLVFAVEGCGALFFF